MGDILWGCPLAEASQTSMYEAWTGVAVVNHVGCAGRRMATGCRLYTAAAPPNASRRPARRMATGCRLRAPCSRPSFCCKNPPSVRMRRCCAGRALPCAPDSRAWRLQAAAGRGMAAGMGRRAGTRKRRKKPRRARPWCAPAPAAPLQARRGQAARTPRWGQPHRWTAPLGCSTRSSESLHPT